MKVFVAKILVEDIDFNSCSVHLFKTLEEAQRFADGEIDDCALGYDGCVTERASRKYSMAAGDIYVTIDIEEHEL